MIPGKFVPTLTIKLYPLRRQNPHSIAHITVGIESLWSAHAVIRCAFPRAKAARFDAPFATVMASIPCFEPLRRDIKPALSQRHLDPVLVQALERYQEPRSWRAAAENTVKRTAVRLYDVSQPIRILGLRASVWLAKCSRAFPLLAQNGHANAVVGCLLLRYERT
jgi:hypothetical protein